MRDILTRCLVQNLTFLLKFLLTFPQTEAPELKSLLAALLVLTEEHSQGPETEKTLINKALHVKTKYQNGKFYCLWITIVILFKD